MKIILILKIKKINMKDNTKGIFYAILTACLWGVLAIVLKVGLSFASPITIVWSRFFIAFIILFIYFLIRDRKKLIIFKFPPLMLVLAATALGFNYLGFITGLNYISPNNAQIMNQMGPITLCLVGFIFFKEKLSKLQAIGFFIALSGLIIFYNEQLNSLINNTSNFNIGALWITLGFISWTLYAVFQKIVVKNYHPQQINMIIYFIPVLMFCPFCDFSTYTKMNYTEWSIMIFLGLNTLFAYGALSAAFKYTQASKQD